MTLFNNIFMIMRPICPQYWLSPTPVYKTLSLEVKATWCRITLIEARGRHGTHGEGERESLEKIALIARELRRMIIAAQVLRFNQRDEQQALEVEKKAKELTARVLKLFSSKQKNFENLSLLANLDQIVKECSQFRRHIHTHLLS